MKKNLFWILGSLELFKPTSTLHLRLLTRCLFSSSSFYISRSTSVPTSFSRRSRTCLPFRTRVCGGVKSYNGGVVVISRALMNSSLSAAEDLQEKIGSHAYGFDQNQVLEGLDLVRKRPGMYISSTGPRGLHHLAYEILDNAVDEAQAGYASKIDVVLHEDNSVSITDNGRGILVDLHPVTKKSSLETVLTIPGNAAVHWATTRQKESLSSPPASPPIAYLEFIFKMILG